MPIICDLIGTAYSIAQYWIQVINTHINKSLMVKFYTMYLFQAWSDMQPYSSNAIPNRRCEQNGVVLLHINSLPVDHTNRDENSSG